MGLVAGTVVAAVAAVVGAVVAAVVAHQAAVTMAGLVAVPCSRHQRLLPRRRQTTRMATVAPAA